MKLNSESYRRLKYLMDQLSLSYFESIKDDLTNGLDIDSPEKVLDTFDAKYNQNYPSPVFTKLWHASEVAGLFSNWYTIYLTEETDVMYRKIRKKLKNFYGGYSRLLVQQITKEPKIILMARITRSCRSSMEKAATDKFSRDSIYWVPEKGMVLTDIHQDARGRDFFEKVESNILGGTESVRIRAMQMKKYYKDTDLLKLLSVKAEHQITGFSGLEKICFVGDNVKLGLRGLHTRQDIRVHLDGIGPRTEVSSEHLDLRIGNQVRIKSIDGISELYNLLHNK